MVLGGACFDFNYYRHIMQLPVFRPEEVDPEVTLIREGLIQGEPLSLVIYGMILSIFTKKIQRDYP